ncbi:aminoacyl-histidine dipeptidase [Proteiniclasticum sp. C24MP]|uniref:aminoacyl-histidine dipeptidase n=1 Tax=Proteiniclasticum sp. C24MP TaxID=3374101 RepID=UPI003753F6B9
MSILSQYEPKKVLHYFEELTKIPRGSGNEKAVSDFLKKFAEERNLQVIQDEVMNIIIKKPGTPGYESSSPVIIQGHMDMVDEKNNDTTHDFSKDPLKLRVMEDHLYATGTTLGADNGIAVAYALAILDSDDIPHPPLEVLITVEEETGMIGAASVEGKHFKGKMLINIDSEEEGTFLVSCAGGARQTVRLPLHTAAAQGLSYKLSITGLKGGHSGMDIIKERGNSNVLLGRTLYMLKEKYDFLITGLHGGSKNNAIPREAEAILVFSGNVDGLLEEVARIETALGKEIETQDDDFNITFSRTDSPAECYDKETTEKAIGLLFTLPNGVISMSQDINGLVETSLNMGVLHEKNHELYFDFAVRSSVGSRKEMVLDKVKAIGDAFGAETEITSSYPEWRYAKDSSLRDAFISVYEKKYGVLPKIEAIHAGLECGILSGRIDGLDMISLGPNLYDVHTPDEHMDLKSVRNVYEFLLDVLKHLK